MTLTVSIGEFRQHITDYIAKAKDGDTIIIKDEKKDEEVAELKGKKTFDPVAYEKALRKAAGVFTAENHPEWRTKRDIVKWLRKTRKSWNRSF